MKFQFEITPFPFSFTLHLLFKIITNVFKKKKWFTLRNFYMEDFKTGLKNFKIIPKCFD